MGALPILSRLYWYTIEFGLIRAGMDYAPSGRASFPRKAKTIYSIESPEPNRIAFDLERVLATEYRIDSYQQTYFVIDSFQQLFDETHRPFAPLYSRLRDVAPYPPNAIAPGDCVIHRGR